MSEKISLDSSAVASTICRSKDAYDHSTQQSGIYKYKRPESDILRCVDNLYCRNHFLLQN